jgi:hypothetical protein
MAAEEEGDAPSSRLVADSESEVDQPLAPFLVLKKGEELLVFVESVRAGFGDEAPKVEEELVSLLEYGEAKFEDLSQVELISEGKLLQMLSLDEFLAIYVYTCEWTTVNLYRFIFIFFSLSPPSPTLPSYLIEDKKN